MATRALSEPFWARHLAWMISGGFLFISLIYISVSDQIVLLLIDDPQRLTFVQSVKGWAFVILTAAMLFLLLHLAMKALRRSRQAEQAANERYRRMIETTNEGVWILDRNGQTTFINQTMASMLQCERDDVLGQPQHAFLDDASNVTQVDQLARQCDGHRDVFECQLRNRDGSPLWALIAASPLEDSEGNMVGIIHMVTDITQRKATEEALRASLESQRELLNELDHRVRNNLSSLISLVDISRGTAGNVGTFADAIRGRIDAMNRAYSLLSSSGWERQNFERLLSLLLPGQFATRVSFTGPRVHFAPYLSGALAIVFHELLTNAIQHGSLSREDGRVEINWVGSESESRCVEVEVSWTETNGPKPSDHVTIGAGLQLVSGLVKSDLRGDVQLDFPASGARHVLHLKLDDAVLDHRPNPQNPATPPSASRLDQNGEPGAKAPSHPSSSH